MSFHHNSIAYRIARLKAIQEKWDRESPPAIPQKRIPPEIMDILKKTDQQLFKLDQLCNQAFELISK
jgi:hypothetical protein